MKPVWWMAGSSAASGALVTAALGQEAGREVWLGMAAPLFVAIATWVLVARVYQTNPEQVTALMMTAFAGKLLLFGVYVAVAIGLLRARPVPFMLSFAGYFVVLHMTEAFCLRRLFAEGMRAI